MTQAKKGSKKQDKQVEKFEDWDIFEEKLEKKRYEAYLRNLEDLKKKVKLIDFKTIRLWGP